MYTHTHTHTDLPATYDFDGAGIVHKGGLLAVYPCHEVSHLGVQLACSPSEVGLIIKHQLQRQTDRALDKKEGTRLIHSI